MKTTKLIKYLQSERTAIEYLMQKDIIGSVIRYSRCMIQVNVNLKEKYYRCTKKIVVVQKQKLKRIFLKAQKSKCIKCYGWHDFINKNMLV